MTTFGEQEKQVLEYWDKIDAFALSNELSKGRKAFSFYDGPPFATGLPHYGHILSGTIKDTVTRFYYQQGRHVERRFGWDCHGLPIEYEIDKLHGIKTKQDVEKIGVAQYNQHCRDIVMKYSSEWEEIVRKMGRWIDFKNGYKTMDFSFMESVWWVFQQLHQKGLVYKGYRVMPYSTKCRTPMSNFEANQNYKDTTDLTATVRLPLKAPLRLGGQEYAKASLLVWTTTPWTLPSNLGVLVNPEMEYALVKDEKKGGNDGYVVLGRFALKKQAAVAVLKGQDLLQLEYAPPFGHFESERAKGRFRVYPADFVQEGAGTGLVHCAPGFGEEDYNAFVKNGLIQENEEVLCPVDGEGCFTSEVPEFAGRHVKEADKEIIRHLKEQQLLYETTSIVHSYPFCWRSDTPLIYKAVPSWFVQVKPFVSELTEKNKEIAWSPESVGVGKFGLWLENAKDWAISRNRYWGTPIPIWIREGAPSAPSERDIICVGSAKELAELSGVEVSDLHKDIVDKVVITRNGETYRRVEEVLDCWFESGSVPYAQKHFPFENQTQFESTFPADFIAEGLDQTRGWFYTLHVLSTLLYHQPAFKNVMVTGLVLAADGKKMSKRLKNYPDPSEVMATHGADAMRLYLISSTVVKAENLKFTEAGVAGILREFLIPWQNCLRFLQTASAPPTGTGCDIEDIALEVSGISMTADRIKESEDGAILDLWILAEFEEFARTVQAESERYQLQHIVQQGIDFVGDLSRWYIRLSRDRLRGKPMEVLQLVLKGLAVVMAPFAPFFSEICYQEVTGLGFEKRANEASGQRRAVSELASLSVHFQLYESVLQESAAFRQALLPQIAKQQQATILADFRSIKEVVEAVRMLREKCGLPLKMPLKEVAIVGLQESPVLSKILAKESNAVAVQYRSAEEYAWEEQIAPDFKKISELHGGQQVQARAAAIRAVATNAEIIKKLLNNGYFTAGSLKVTKAEVTYRRAVKELAAQYQGIAVSDTVYLVADTTRDAAIDELWLKREIRSAVQKLRKKAGLQVADQAVLSVSGVDGAAVICDRNTQLVAAPLPSGVSEELSVGRWQVTLTLALQQ